jgi:hypothetical protein
MRSHASNAATAPAPIAFTSRSLTPVRHTLQLGEVTIRDQRQDVNVVVIVVHRDDPVGKVHRRVGDR